MIITDVQESFDKSVNVGCLVRDFSTMKDVFRPDPIPEDKVEDVSSPYIQMDIESQHIDVPQPGVHVFYDEVLHKDRFRKEQSSSKLRRRKLRRPHEYLDRLSNDRAVWQWIIDGGGGDFFLVICLITLEHKEGQYQDARRKEGWYFNDRERVIGIQYQLWSFDSLSYRKFGDEYLKWKEENKGLLNDRNIHLGSV